MATPALVSVLIRTLGRPTLARSIAAAAAQTHRPIEIVVVNAGTAPLEPHRPAGVELRVVGEGPYDRPRAANAALAHARGDWLIFLDDDDAFAPTHVEGLLDALGRAPGARVAYSATAVVEPDGKARMVIGADFNRLHLFIGNYMQIGAALFHRSLVEEGARFDERLDCYEDWDFIIQLAQRTWFTYNAKPTNLWCAHAGESGAGMGANKRDDATRPYQEMVQAKWAALAAELNARAARSPAEAERIVRGPLPDGPRGLGAAFE
jgi:glycosyltransferase involved in cell wall biosynthesis